MAITIQEARREDLPKVIPLLLQAEPSESALRWSLKNLSDAAYSLCESGETIGAATVRWKREPCEIIELAIARERQGRGLGKHLVLWLIEEARRRGKQAIFVGTSNTSTGNILFYQKCGFRMQEVRQDYFWYYDEPIFEQGIQVRDMLVFRFDLTGTHE